VQLVHGAGKILTSTLMGRVMQGLVSYLAADPRMAREFRTRVVARRQTEVRRLIDRWVQRGDLRPDADFDILNELLFGPLYYRLFLSGGRIDRAFARRVVEAILPAYEQPRRARSRKGRTPAMGR
jgi:Tetracyclin repressor-like, C-terminal domain